MRLTSTQLLSTDIDEIVDGLSTTFWSQFAGKRILLTGGRGFLGRYFTEVFLRLNERVFLPAGWKPCELVVLDNMITAGDFGKKGVENRPGVSFVNHSIIEPFVPERPFDFVLHAAGIASPAWYRKFPEETYEVAIEGTKNVLGIARKSGPACRVLYFSSSEIYGDPDPAHVPTREDYKGHVACLGPRACYDSSKRMAETIVEVAAQRHGVQASIVRPFNFYGPGMQRQDERVLPNFAKKWVDGEPLQLYGNGRQTRTYCYVTDGIRGCLQVLANGAPGEAYNIGNPSPEIAVWDLAELAEKVVGSTIARMTMPHPTHYPADEPQRRCPDIGKARGIGYEPKVELEDGLRRFFGWADSAYRAEKAA